jgi:hypothetical protein
LEKGRPAVDLQLFDNVRKIHLNCSDCVAPSTMDVDAISMVDCRIKGFSFCSNIKSVTICKWDKSFTGIFDCALFQNIEKGCFKLNFVTPFTNHHLLCNLTSLDLSTCQSIVDVSCFQNIPQLTLNCCLGITDVSSLGRVHTLNLGGCRNIHDVSALGRVYTLDLSYCEKVTDLSALEWVYSLSFCEFRGTELSGLKHVVILDIFYASFVTDITMLHTLQVLNIVECPGISSLNGLPKLRELWISETGRLKITSGKEVLPRVVKIHLVGIGSPCSQFLSALDHVHDLALC